MAMPKKILVPTDFSDTAEEAMRAALDLARGLDAQVTLFHVYGLPNYVLPDGSAILADAPTLVRVGEAVDQSLRVVAARAYDALGRGVQTESSPGEPVHEIVRAATEGAYDLIVIGTHGRTGFKRWFLGSVAERVVRHAPCPVLTVRPRAEKEKH